MYTDTRTHEKKTNKRTFENGVANQYLGYLIDRHNDYLIDF